MIVADWVERARAYLQGGHADIVNRLAADYAPGDQELVFQYELNGITNGSVLSAGRACFMSWQMTPSTNQVEITPGWAGAQDVGLPAGTIVRIKPRYLDHMLFDAVCEAVVELSNPDIGLFGVDQVTVDYEPQRSVYDLINADGLEQVISVLVADPSDATDRWVQLRSGDWSLTTIEPTPEFPSGQLLKINYLPQSSDLDTIYVTYRKRFDIPGDIDVDVETVGLPDTALDLPALGAAQRLAYSQESKRTSTNAQGDARRAAEVPAGASLGAARAISALYRQRCQQEYARLVRQYGISLR